MLAAYASDHWRWRLETIRTPKTEIALVTALREKPSIRAACRRAKISRNAFYDWVHDDPDFKQRIQDAKAEGLDALEDALTERGLQTDTTAAIFLLKSHRREVYGDRITNEHTGKDGAPLTVVIERVSS